ncbi:amino acid adenylation domain-containing protein [Fictibacillus nanhaiensis]|uniref:amino acid adenylation domain-containing protein n=1 Tax=Fictibacillus nanhaiensis TaxID=742169 RepID=UPI003C273FD0
MEELLPQQRHIIDLEKSDSTFSYFLHYTFILEGNLIRSVFEDTVKEFWHNNYVFHFNNAIVPSIKYVDLSKCDRQEQITQINEISSNSLNKNNEKKYHFDSLLIELSENKNVLIITYPAITSDISTQLIMDTISQIYKSKLEGFESNKNHVPFLRVTEWLNNIENSEERIYSKQYWTDRLTEAENQEVLFKKIELNGNVGVFKPRTKKISLETNNDLLKRIKELVNDNYHVSDYLVAIWTLQLSRLLNTKMVNIGYYCEGRGIDQLKGIIGPISKYVPLCVDIDEERTRLNDHLDNIIKLTKECKESQIEFSRNHTKDLSEIQVNNYFKYGFDYEEIESVHMGSNLSIQIENLYMNIDKNDLRISCINNNESIILNLYYDSYQFSEEDMERVLYGYSSLLVNSIKDFYCKCLDIGFDKKEKNESSLIKIDHFVHKEFEKKARLYPDMIALVFKDKSLSFRQLNQLANKYAALMKEKGIQKGDIIAISMDRTLEYVISILAVIKVGGTYLPMDYKFPMERVKYLINDSSVNLLLTDNNQNTSEIEVEQIIVSSFLDSDLENYKDIDYSIEPHDLVYTIYTSGSTGVPKGVLVEHAQLSNYLMGLKQNISINPGDVCAHLSSFATDLGNTILFLSLCKGGTLHIVPNDILNDPDELDIYMTKNQVDIYKITPTHLSNLISGGAHDLLPRKYLILGGETPKSNLLKEIVKSRKCKVFNHYGPTETTVGVLMHNFSIDDSLNDSPIGKPLINTQVYVLDSFLRPVPVGFPGVLYIGGANVSRGYLKKADLTAEQFIPDHISGIPGARLYRTGDLVRYNSKGQIIYLQRMDNQYKFNGYRLESEEIENCLEEIRDIKKAVVVVKEENELNQRIVAYLLPNKQNKIQKDSLPDYLKQRLPEYMVPYTYVIVDKMPMFPNGKINKKALLNLTIDSTSEYTVPVLESDAEKKLLSIWKEVLKVEQIGVEDNLFKLGGHSLSATQIIIRVRKAFDVNIPLRVIFDSPTIKGLAKIIEETLEEK